MRKILVFILLIQTLGVLRGQTNQNSDPAFVSLTQSPVDNPVGSEAVIRARISNSGTDPIVASGILVTFSWSSLYEYVGFDENDTGFTLVNSGPQTITLRNTNNEIESANLEVLDLLVTVRAVVEGELQSITGNVQRAPGMSSQVGNGSTSNDNAQGGQSVSGAQPVEYLNFEVNARGNDSELIWETASEMNNSHFEVERSVDGRSWDYVGRVEGKGTTGREQSYIYTDGGIGKKLSTVYYRLIQVDYDGSESESEVRVVNFADRGGEVSIYPNPVRDELNVNYSGGSTYRVLIYDMMGKLVSESRGDSKIDMSVYKGGTYTVRVLDGSGSMIKTESVVVIR